MENLSIHSPIQQIFINIYFAPGIGIHAGNTIGDKTDMILAIPELRI